MMSYCCGGGREEQQGSSKTLRRPTSEGGLNWLSEASSQWQGESESGDGATAATTFGWGHNDTTLTIEVLRSKRLRSGFRNCNIFSPFVRVILSDGSTDDSRLLCKTGIGKKHKNEDAVTWNFKAVVECSRAEIVSPSAVLRFEVLDADDWEMMVMREFCGQALVDLITKGAHVKKTVKLPHGGGIPSRGDRSPSLHVGVTATPDPYSDIYSNSNLHEVQVTPPRGTTPRSSPILKGGVGTNGGGGGDDGGGGGDGERSADLNNVRRTRMSIDTTLPTMRKSKATSNRVSQTKSSPTNASKYDEDYRSSSPSSSRNIRASKDFRKSFSSITTEDSSFKDTPTATNNEIDIKQWSARPANDSVDHFEHLLSFRNGDSSLKERRSKSPAQRETYEEDVGETEDEARRVINALGQGMVRFESMYDSKSEGVDNDTRSTRNEDKHESFIAVVDDLQ